MNTSWKELTPTGFSSESRIWIYQSNRPLDPVTLAAIKHQLQEFYTHWISHNRPVKGWAGLLFDQFILIVADDTADRLCGSAVDSSVRLIKHFEDQYKLSLLDRMQLAFMSDKGIEILAVQQLAKALAEGKITPETIYFNNIVTTLGEMQNNWMIEVKNSWIGKRFLQTA